MIEVNDESGFEPDVAVTEVSQLASYVLAQMRVHPQADLAILFVDAETMADLHMQWMDLPGPTDVLSFPMDEIRPAPPGTNPEPGMLGDIVICPPVAASQARRSGHATMDEILLLVTHGILHLLGYDHFEPEEKKEMFALQRKLLLTFLAQNNREVADIAPTVDEA